MAKKNDNRINIEIKCPDCGHVLRPTQKNKKNTPDRIEIKSYCPKCKTHKTFKEKK